MAYTSIEIIDNWMDFDFKFFTNREGGIKERMKFLVQDENMKDEYLGACLDYIRWGGKTTVMYELGTKGMINFIQHWMNLNQDNLIWSDEEPPKDFILPYVKYDKCPRNVKHTGTIKDLAGRVRCPHKSEKKLKPSFVGTFTSFDEHSKMDKIDYFEEKPKSLLPDFAWDEQGNLLPEYMQELEEYQGQLKKFEEEESTFVINNYCYAILSDQDMILSLEEVLDRLNLEPKTKLVYCPGIECERLDEIPKNKRWIYEGGICQGHRVENNQTIHPFDGWELALYVQKWHEQFSNGQVLVFGK